MNTVKIRDKWLTSELGSGVDPLGEGFPLRSDQKPIMVV